MPQFRPNKASNAKHKAPGWYVFATPALLIPQESDQSSANTTAAKSATNIEESAS
jgi:hypothetical protein